MKDFDRPTDTAPDGPAAFEVRGGREKKCANWICANAVKDGGVFGDKLVGWVYWLGRCFVPDWDEKAGRGALWLFQLALDEAANDGKHVLERRVAPNCAVAPVGGARIVLCVPRVVAEGVGTM